MNQIKREEAEGFQVFVYNLFPVVDLTLFSNVWDHGEKTEVVHFIGEDAVLDELEDTHLPKLLGQGDGATYRWISARRVAGGHLELWCKNLRPPAQPMIEIVDLASLQRVSFSELLKNPEALLPRRIELVDRTLRRDIIKRADLFVNPSAQLTVVNPWGEMVRCLELKPPIEPNGKIVLGLAA